MTRARAVAALIVAALAAVGAVLSWVSARSLEMAAPVLAGEPSQPAQAYDPSLVALAMFLAAVTGVLAVLGVAGLRR